MNIRNILLTSVAAGALAVTVGACTHSGDDGIPQSQLDAETEAKEAAEKKAAEEQAAKEKAEAEAQAEKERADALQREKDAEQDKADRAAAKALFTMLQDSDLAISGNPAVGGVTTGQPGGTAREEQVTLPALGMADSDGMFSKKVPGVQYTAFVDSTQEAASSKLFGDSDFAELSGRYVDGVYSFETDNPAANAGIKSSSFPASGGSRVYPADQRQFSGTFHEAPGMYSCSGASCEATWTANGIDLSEGWTFTPNDGARVTVPDPSFQTFGWWLLKNADGSMDAGPVHDHSFGDGNGLAGFVTLQGTATYKGKAVGKYAIYSGAFSERSEAGHFSANATLNANFGDDNAAGSISGIIDAFTTDAGAKEWNVSLDEDSDIASGTFSGTTTWTIGDVSSTDDQGAYAGQMFDTRADQDNLPYEAGGTFDAQFEAGVGEMIGSFAATRSED